MMHRFAIVTLSLSVSVAACGGDDAPPAAPPQAPVKRKAPANKVTGQGQAGELVLTDKVPDEFRAELKQDQFAPDPTGEINRDPFRSYVINVKTLVADDSPDAARSECNPDEWKAKKLDRNALTLTGILQRGTIGYAQFIGPGNKGYLVRRKWCIGREEAVVDYIGDNAVTLLVPNRAATLTGAVAEPTRIEIALDPDALNPANTLSDDD